MTKTILVTGATGKQGGGVLCALLESGADVNILGLTRNPNSEKAKQLSEKHPNVKWVKGDLDKPSEIFENAKKDAPEGIWGVFSVQVSMGDGHNVEMEEIQGKGLIDESIKANVKFFVYTSVDRGGDKRSYENPTNIPHFKSKHNIEQHLLAKTKNGEMQWTILRPVAFLENYGPGFFGKAMSAMWKSVGDKPLQHISVRDIGFFAKEAFLNPDENNGKAISLAGDELTYEKANKIFRREMGYELPITYRAVGWLMQALVKELGTMFAWFKEEGYGADIEDLRKKNPKLIDWETYIVKYSGYPKKN